MELPIHEFLDGVGECEHSPRNEDEQPREHGIQGVYIMQENGVHHGMQRVVGLLRMQKKWDGQQDEQDRYTGPHLSLFTIIHMKMDGTTDTRCVQEERK